MRIINFAGKVIFLLTFLMMVADCNKEIVVDPCLKTKWPQPKEYEIKLAVHMVSSNDGLPGGAPGSQNPADFENIVVSGNIEKVDCSKEKSGFFTLGNSYINKDLDVPAFIDVPQSYWIGHVVYVYALANDSDRIKFYLMVTIKMKDNQSYICFISEEIYYQNIVQMSMQNYYYILLNINSDNWVKI